MSGGSIRVSRDLWDDGRFKHEPFTEREAWIWMNAEASWKDRHSRGVDLKRGQLAHSIRFLAGAWGWEQTRVHRFLKRLEKRNAIATDTATGVKRITICEYDENQSCAAQSATQTQQQRNASATNENKGEIKDSSPPSIPPKRKLPSGPIPDDWAPSQASIETGRERGMSDERIQFEAQCFRDHAEAHDRRCARWDAAFTNWLRKSRNPQSGPPGAPRGGLFAEVGAALDAACGDQRGAGEPCPGGEDVDRSEGGGAVVAFLPSQRAAADHQGPGAGLDAGAGRASEMGHRRGVRGMAFEAGRQAPYAGPDQGDCGAPDFDDAGLDSPWQAAARGF